MGQSRAAVPIIRVRGEAEIEAEPELVRITSVVRAFGRSPDLVRQRIAELRGACVELIDGYGPAIDRYEASRPTVEAGGRDVLRTEPADVYTAVMTLTITVGDLTILGDLTKRLCTADLTEIRGIRWGLRTGSQAHRRAMRAAAEDAVVRGGEYAAALGCRLTGLVELADAGLTTTAGRAPLSLDEEGWLMEGTAPPPGLAPERQVVHARVEARFTATRITRWPAPDPAD